MSNYEENNTNRKNKSNWVKPAKYYKQNELEYADLAKGGFYPKCGRDRALVDTLIDGYPPTKKLFACNTIYKSLAQKYGAKIIERHYQETEQKNYYYYRFTFIHRKDYTGAKYTEINIKGIKQCTRNLLSKIKDVEFIAVIEIQGMTNKEHVIKSLKKGNIICAHVHGLFRTTELLHPKELSKELSKSMPKLIGKVDPVKISIMPRDKKKFGSWMMYMLKSPKDLKRSWKQKEADKKEGNRVEEIRSEGNKRTKRFKRLLRRLAEIESYMSIDELMFASGYGVKIRSKILKAVAAGVDLQRPFHPSDDEFQFGADDFTDEALDALWANERDDGRAMKFKRPIIITKYR